MSATENDKQSIFIFYTLAMNADLHFHDIPEGWNWIGAGMTYPICNTSTWKGWIRSWYRTLCGPPSKYKREEQFMGPKEEQFMGPKETKEEMKRVLDKHLGDLKGAGIVKFYKIEETFSP
jgi:hypothetical protein